METIVTGIVANGVVILATPLPEGAEVEVCVKSGPPNKPATNLRPSELLKLPRAERDVILAAAAALAEQDYREDKDLTGFDAFSEELDDDSDEGGNLANPV
jgi:hypothetical protein